MLQFIDEKFKRFSNDKKDSRKIRKDSSKRSRKMESSTRELNLAIIKCE